MIDYDSIPELTRHSIDEYVRTGRNVGDFLTSVICNDLKRAFAYADVDNIKAMHSIVAYFYNRTPSQCWGSIEEMNAWMELQQDATTRIELPAYV